MTERLEDIRARIDGIRQLGAVVNAMKGIAVARARTARTQIKSVNSYAETIAAAMSSMLELDERAVTATTSSDRVPGRTGLLIFLAEQGFAGAFSERVLDGIGAEWKTASLFLIGSRGLPIAKARGLAPFWTAPMPSRALGIPKLADEITKAIYRAVNDGHIQNLDVIHADWSSPRPRIRRQALFPIDMSKFQAKALENPIIQLPPHQLTINLSADYLHAEVCKAALHAVTAENEARLEAMSAANSQIAQELDTFQAKLRQVRQEAITDEIIELRTAAGGARDRN